MIEAKKLDEVLGAEFYAGVPDSQLKPLCDYLMDTYGIDATHHIIAANEGNCVATAAGYHLATGKTPVVYMQNSGEGNIINPVASLLNDKVYAIPMIFVIGWRGEPGTKDEPQHIYQGEVTLTLLENMGIEFFVIRQETTEEELKSAMLAFQKKLAAGKNVAFVVSKNAIAYNSKTKYKNDYTLSREEIIEQIIQVSGTDPVVCTTGKASRELFELRTANDQNHERDFLTVGSMGHSSSIALGIALNKPISKIWCIDGDGAVLMHMGSMAVLGAQSPKNLIHIVINNEAHETVGGMPTVATAIDLTLVAKACGYPKAVCVEDIESLKQALEQAKIADQLFFIEVKATIGAREDLGRPTTTALANKKKFMEYLNKF